MASNRTITPRTVLVMILLACAIIFVGANLQHGNGGKKAPKPSASLSAQVPVIDQLCSQVTSRVKDIADPQKYTRLCSQARQAWSNDQTDLCTSKLKSLGDMLNSARVASIPDATIARACKPKRIEA